MKNILLQTDSYKTSHWVQYPPHTTRVASYFESRGGFFESIVVFGLQYILMEYLEGKRVTKEYIEEADDVITKHMGPGIFNRKDWEHILREHGGRLPVSIKAVPEGTIVPPSNVLMTVENTDPKVPWLTNYLETLLVQTWYPSTVATQSRYMKNAILQSLIRTGDPTLLPFKLHDFGYRGSTSDESAGIGGLAHLVNFQGTDTMAALVMARKYYKCDMAGFSIPAAEHSTVTSWGKQNEAAAYLNMLEKFPTGLVAVVSDSFDITNATRHIWGELLKDKVIARDGVLVVRPDSGDPPQIVLLVHEILGEKFGYTINQKGFKVLHPKVRIIQGDGIDKDMVVAVLNELETNHWSADNIAFGSGGGLLQKVNRDTCKFAFKCSAIEIDGNWYDVMKSPITAPDKISKAGRLKLITNGGSYKTVRVQDDPMPDQLVEVFRNGALLNTSTFDQVRDRAKI